MPKEILELRVDELLPDPNQPRKTFSQEELGRLAESIAARGVLMPLRVRWNATRAAWIVVSGECRLLGARKAGMNTVPCVAVEGEPDEADVLADQIAENTARNALRSVQLGRALAKLKALKGWNSQELAGHVGMSGSSISRLEAVLTLPDVVQQMVDEGRVPVSAAAELARLGDEQAVVEMAQAVAEGRMHRGQVIDAVQARVGKKNVPPNGSRVSCKLGGGMSFTVSAPQPITWDTLLATLDAIRKEAKSLYAAGKPLTELTRSLQTT